MDMLKVKHLKGRWLNKEYDCIAIRCKGKWIYYEKMD